MNVYHSQFLKPKAGLFVLRCHGNRTLRTLLFDSSFCHWTRLHFRILLHSHGTATSASISLDSRNICFHPLQDSGGVVGSPSFPFLCSSGAVQSHTYGCCEYLNKNGNVMPATKLSGFPLQQFTNVAKYVNTHWCG